jgi:hypothetical protein
MGNDGDFEFAIPPRTSVEVWHWWPSGYGAIVVFTGNSDACVEVRTYCTHRVFDDVLNVLSGPVNYARYLLSG